MCKVMEDLGKDYFNEGRAGGWAGGEEKKAKEIADMVGYDLKTVESWISDYKATLS